MNADASPRVLIVEDEAVVALDIERSVRKLGYAVLGPTATAEEAVRLAERERPELILMDIRLKGAMDGIEAGRQIRSSLGLPVIYLTAHADEATLSRAKQTAPYGYLLKPFDEQKLRVALELALSKHAREQAAERYRRDLLAVLDALPMGTLLIDVDGQLSFANDVARRMLTLADRTLGKPWAKALRLPAEAHAELVEQLSRPSESRLRVAVGLGDPPLQALEIEVADDPRETAGRILFLHDVSEVRALRAQLNDEAAFENMVGRSDEMKRVFRAISDLAQVDSTVLIRGETGTGKELVARALHNRSQRRLKPFVAVNCGGLSDELAASQLFGHSRGSFTGAFSDHQGYFEAAQGGVLFLDEIGELSERTQAALLRVIEHQQVVRVGENQTRDVDVRLLAATHRDLDKEIAEGRFRADLYYRIRVAQVDLPPLLDRREDIPLLAEVFLALARATTGKPVAKLHEQTLSVLLDYPWPGNVRELRNAVEFGVIRCQGDSLLPADLPPELHGSPSTAIEGDTEEDRIRSALARAGGRRKRAAELLGISRATFYRRLKSLEIDLD